MAEGNGNGSYGGRWQVVAALAGVIAASIMIGSAIVQFGVLSERLDALRTTVERQDMRIKDSSPMLQFLPIMPTIRQLQNNAVLH